MTGLKDADIWSGLDRWPAMPHYRAMHCVSNGSRFRRRTALAGHAVEPGSLDSTHDSPRNTPKKWMHFYFQHVGRSLLVRDYQIQVQALNESSRPCRARAAFTPVVI